MAMMIISNYILLYVPFSTLKMEAAGSSDITFHTTEDLQIYLPHKITLYIIPA
jgi:hypothetical protein